MAGILIPVSFGSVAWICRELVFRILRIGPELAFYCASGLMFEF